MTVKEAFRLVPDKQKFEVGHNYFALLRWEHPESGGKTGPILISVSGDQAIEIDLDGTFKKSFPAEADNYFPFLDQLKKPRKQQLARIIDQCLRMVGW